MNYSIIELSKTGKRAGKYKAIVSVEDAEYVMQFNWQILLTGNVSYACRTSKKKCFYLHREIMKQMLGHDIPEGMEVDHIDGDGLNCARPNLRLATKAQNGINRGKNKNNTSGYKGVIWYEPTHKWIAQIMVNGKHICIGYFKTKELAHEAYCKAAKKYFGEYANNGQEVST